MVCCLLTLLDEFIEFYRKVSIQNLHLRFFLYFVLSIKDVSGSLAFLPLFSVCYGVLTKVFFFRGRC